MKYLKQKKYLITNFQKLNYPLGSKIVFIDEYLFNLYPKKIRKMYKCSYIHSLASSKKIFNISGLILKKKYLFIVTK